MNPAFDFTDISYLQAGTPLQQQVYAIVTRHRLLEVLGEYGPILIGSIPIRVAIADSDIDISCCYKDAIAFRVHLQTLFGDYPLFRLREGVLNGLLAVIANFEAEGVPVEIFGQPIPAKEQYGYRHMLIEYRVLQERGEGFREQVVALKVQGRNTEAAFCELLGLAGHPFEVLLTLE
ncbi:DUF4269 domain-containing protein [Chitinophaga pendula]|uniref:DUF4269 domain-containing protein n=1 Tax=Chitinophaga TaxID=79328 RepID=UPI000BB032C5|nr:MULTISPECIES: DUF4269 domain-containing protein [Chitinophaga]ASZ13645.1 diadenosine tetraphosphate hydrolase [Chitinophaga sp. MD30]UCJ08729.1 DUF4269 domain-containing protein [Chitinophaga pendula]